jgi:hypothetical protein
VKLSRRPRKSTGSAITETAAGLCAIIPILFILIDVSALVLAQTANDQMSKQCCRAAATQPYNAGSAAAQTALADYPVNGLVVKQGPCLVTYPTQDTVRAQTTIKCNLPVPVPLGGPSSANFVAFATMPLVGAMPTNTDNPISQNNGPTAGP